MSFSDIANYMPNNTASFHFQTLRTTCLTTQHHVIFRHCELRA